MKTIPGGLPIESYMVDRRLQVSPRHTALPNPTPSSHPTARRTDSSFSSPTPTPDMHTLPTRLVAALILSTLVFTAQAQTPIKPFIGIGLTGGGDEVSPAVPGENAYRPAKTSGFVHAYLGGMYMPSANQGLSLSVGLQGGTVNESGKKKRYEFSRYPVELGYRQRIFSELGVGVGLRKSLGTHIRMPNAERAYEPEIKSGLGYFGEVRLGLGEDFSMYARYTVERFDVSNVGKVNGNHAGIYLEFAR